MANRRLVLIMIILLVILMGGFLAYTLTRNKPPSLINEPQGTGTVAFVNTDRLRQILLVEQYAEVLDNMVFVIQKNVGNDVSAANIDSLTVEKDSSIHLIVSLRGKDKKINVIIKRIPRSLEKLEIIIPEYNYSKTIDPY